MELINQGYISLKQNSCYAVTVTFKIMLNQAACNKPTQITFLYANSQFRSKIYLPIKNIINLKLIDLVLKSLLQSDAGFNVTGW